MRGKKKPGFLKVFERTGERDNRPLLDLGGNSFHDDGPSPFAAPGDILNSDNEQDDDDDDEFATDQTPTTSNQNNTRATASDTVEPPKRNSYAESAEASPRNSDCSRVGELPTKPGRGKDNFGQEGSSRRGFFGSRKGNTLATSSSSADSDSSDSEGDYRFKAAVTTT